MTIAASHARRSLAGAFAAAAVRQGANYAASHLGNYIGRAARSAYDSYSMPSHSRRGTKRKRTPGSSSRSKRRRTRMRRRFRPKSRRGRFPAGKGRYQKRFPLYRYRGLNTNFSRNDYDSIREVASKGVMFPTSLARAVQNFNTSIADLDFAQTKIMDYQEYRYVDLCMVLTPINIAAGAQKLEMNDNSTPYLYYAKRFEQDAPTVTDLETWKNTPGVQRVPLLGTKPIIIPLAVQAPVEDEIIASSTGSAFTVVRQPRKIGWLENPQTSLPIVAANYPNFGNVTVCLPQLALGSFQPKWRVEYYVTMLFRGNRNLIQI